MLFLEVVRHVNITYNLGNIADWVSAIGTVLAVAVALVFNRRNFARQDIAKFQKELERFRSKDYQSHQKEAQLYVNLVNCLYNSYNDKKGLPSKGVYLKALVPTLSEMHKELLNNPLLQYQVARVISVINNTNDFSNKEASKINNDLLNIARSYRTIVNKHQNNIEEKLNSLEKIK